VSTTSSAQQSATGSAIDIEAELLSFLERRAKVAVAPDTDLFASGALTSLLSLELVGHVESICGVSIAADELTLDNFRSVESMVRLVERLSSGGDSHG